MRLPSRCAIFAEANRAGHGIAGNIPSESVMENRTLSAMRTCQLHLIGMDRAFQISVKELAVMQSREGTSVLLNDESVRSGANQIRQPHVPHAGELSWGALRNDGILEL